MDEKETLSTDVTLFVLGIDGNVKGKRERPVAKENVPSFHKRVKISSGVRGVVIISQGLNLFHICSVSHLVTVAFKEGKNGKV